MVSQLRQTEEYEDVNMTKNLKTAEGELYVEAAK